MALLLNAPGNYRGAYPALGGELERASWYFDESRGRLVYRVGRQAAFEALGGPSDVVELHVEFVYEDRDGDGGYDAGRDGFGGLRLAAATLYRWTD